MSRIFGLRLDTKAESDAATSVGAAVTFASKIARVTEATVIGERRTQPLTTVKLPVARQLEVIILGILSIA